MLKRHFRSMKQLHGRYSNQIHLKLLEIRKLLLFSYELNEIVSNKKLWHTKYIQLFLNSINIFNIFCGDFTPLDS